jgi:hypothetical protein
MSETLVRYETAQSLLKPDANRVTLDAGLRAQLLDLERQLISALVTVQKQLGKEPTVLTRAERRAR